MERIKTLNQQFRRPTLDVWTYMGLDSKLSPEAVQKRKATQEMITAAEKDLLVHQDETSFPFWIIPKLKTLGINGLQIKDFGAPGFSTLEAGAMVYELSKVDSSIGGFFVVHNAIGMAVIDTLGDEEQRARLLPPAVQFDKILAFGLTEPQNGSDASDLRTTATPTEGGWLINGQKRWIGNSTFGSVIVWARNTASDNKIQAFLVEKGSPGFTAQKMEGKLSMRLTQNGHLTFRDCFVPQKNKLTLAKDFASGTNKILESSRVMVCWMGLGIAVGAYEAALQYTLSRQQFGKPIAKFQLVQERLSRMLTNCEVNLSLLVHLSEEFDAGRASMGRIARAKATTTRLGRETVKLAREVCGGNGILMENRVIKAFMDMEATHTYEGTYDINSLVSGRELTGGLSALR